MIAEKQTLKVFTIFRLPFLSKSFRIKSSYLLEEMKKYLFNLGEFFTNYSCLTILYNYRCNRQQPI